MERASLIPVYSNPFEAIMRILQCSGRVVGATRIAFRSYHKTNTVFGLSGWCDYGWLRWVSDWQVGRVAVLSKSTRTIHQRGTICGHRGTVPSVTSVLGSAVHCWDVARPRPASTETNFITIDDSMIIFILIIGIFIFITTPSSPSPSTLR